MSILLDQGYGASEQEAHRELEREGFSAETRDYAAGSNEPHQHDYDVCLYVLEGEFRVTDAERGIVHACRPGDRLRVPSGTPHSEEHGPVRLVVGRRH